MSGIVCASRPRARGPIRGHRGVVGAWLGVFGGPGGAAAPPGRARRLVCITVYRLRLRVFRVHWLSYLSQQLRYVVCLYVCHISERLY